MQMTTGFLCLCVYTYTLGFFALSRPFREQFANDHDNKEVLLVKAAPGYMDDDNKKKTNCARADSIPIVSLFRRAVCVYISICCDPIFLSLFLYDYNTELLLLLLLLYDIATSKNI